MLKLGYGRICFIVRPLFFLLSMPFEMFAQSPTPLSFFPHHDGDIWEYYDPLNPTSYEQNIITSDSLGVDGRYYIETTMAGEQIVDTAEYRVYWYNFTYLLYELDADSGETWVANRSPGNPGLTLLATVVAVYQTYVLGDNLATVEEIDYTDSASGLLLCTDYLASDFGLIGQDVDAFPVRRIRGALINGVQFGTITSVNLELRSILPRTSVLYQNYPNPFNPATRIEYSLPHRAFVRLKVYDILGREISTLVDKTEEAGSHMMEWDAKGFPSGVYFYRLEIDGSTTRTRKMMVVR